MNFPLMFLGHSEFKCLRRKTLLISLTCTSMIKVTYQKPRETGIIINMQHLIRIFSSSNHLVLYVKCIVHSAK